MGSTRILVMMLCISRYNCIRPETLETDDHSGSELDCFVSGVDEESIDPIGSSFRETDMNDRTDEVVTKEEVEQFGCFVSVEESGTVDPLGCSLMQSDSTFMFDELGSSMIDIINQSHENTSESRMVDVPNSSIYIALTSTPKKGQSSTTLQFVDVEEFSTVLASPFVGNIRDDVVKLSSRRKPKLAERALTHSNIRNSLTNSCKCKNECMDKLTYEIVHRQRNEYWTKLKEQRKQWLITKLTLSQKCGHCTYVFLDNGQGICLKALEFVLNISKNTLTKHKMLSSRGALSVYPAIREMSVKSVECIAWIEGYATMYADRMPNTKDILLPYRTIKKHVYQTYVSEMEHSVSESTFYSVWTKHFPHLKVKKSKSFSQCIKCAVLQRKFESTLCPVTRLELRKERSSHNQRQMLERKYYYSKRQASKQHPDEFLSLIIDGMDQSKTDLPHFIGRQAKSINPAALLKTHITGVISHGHGMFASFLDILQYPHDPNLTINVILSVLQKISETKGNLPTVLYLQMDNSPRDNKNKYVMGFCEALVRLNVFNEVHISFLYVGHTHEDIDASFSRISEKLRKSDAETVQELLDLVANMELLSNLLDVKEWLSNSLTKIKGISEPLHFKIVKTGVKIKVFYKGQQHKLWNVLDGRGTFLRSLPTGRAKVLKPNYDKIIEKVDALKKQISNIKNMFKNERNFMWWLEFLNNVKSIQNRKTISWITQLPKQRKIIKLRNMMEILDPELRKMLDKETNLPKISCEKLKKLKANRSKKTPRRQNNQSAEDRSSRQKNHQTAAFKKKVVSSTNDNVQGKRGKSRTGRWKVMKYTCEVVLLDSERKRHIWMMIFLNLLGHITLILLFLLTVFMIFRAIEHLFLLLENIWTVMLKEHTGAFLCKVAIESYKSSSLAYMCRIGVVQV